MSDRREQARFRWGAPGTLCIALLSLIFGSLYSSGCRPVHSDQEHTTEERAKVISKLERSFTPAPPGLELAAAFTLPERLLVDFYGARQTGAYLAFGCARLRPPGNATEDVSEESARAAARALAFVDVDSGALRILPTVNRGWSTAAIAGAGGWLLTRERHPEPESACSGESDCWSWALYAYRLPSSHPTLLSRSTAPESQTHLPEPRYDSGAFIWVEGTGPKTPLSVKTWRAADESATSVIGSVELDQASPIFSVSAGTVWLDERDADDGPPSLRSLSLSGSAGPRLAFSAPAYFPVVSGRRVAYAASEQTEQGAQGADPAFTSRAVLLGQSDERASKVATLRKLTTASDVWDLAWLDDRRLVVVGTGGVEVIDVDTPSAPIARVGQPLACAARVGDGHLVLVTRDNGRDIVSSFKLQ